LLPPPAFGDNAAMEAEPQSNRFKHGDRVRINEGVFKNFVGVVDILDESNGRAAVHIQVYGRTTPVELEQRQLDPA
jgi:transcription termination/antitermination protein NusG